MVDKCCTVCKLSKPLESFRARSDVKNGRRSECKACQVEAIRTIQEKKRIEAKHFLGGACQTCGYNRCLNALDFHHVGDKEHTISKMYLNQPLSKILQEVKKCMLLCANCHREHHAVHKPKNATAHLKATFAMMMADPGDVLRKCTGCKKDLPLRYFPTRMAQGKVVRRPTCKLCFSESVLKIIRDKRSWIKNLFGAKCEWCGYSTSLEALDFHHRGAKDSAINRMCSQNGYNKILKEALKCELICANCHRELHSRE